MAVSSSKIQDIHIEDKDIWAQFQTKYKAGDYAGAWQLIADTQFGNKKDVASIWNQIAADLVYVQGLDDPDFGSGKIRVATTIPDDIKDGEVWFQLTNETDGLITIRQCTSATNKTNDTLYPKTIATNVLGGSDMTAYPISPKNADAAISKLADGLYDVSMKRTTGSRWNHKKGNEFKHDSPIDPSKSFRTIVYQNGIYLGFLGGYFHFYKSEDGLNFSECPKFEDQLQKYNPYLVAGGNYFYCLGEKANTIYIYRSEDGETWSRRAAVGSSNYYWGLYYTNGFLIACRRTPGENSFLYSTDFGDTLFSASATGEVLSWNRVIEPSDIGYCPYLDTYYVVIPEFNNQALVANSTTIYKQKGGITGNWSLKGVYEGNYYSFSSSNHDMTFFPKGQNRILTNYTTQAEDFYVKTFDNFILIGAGGFYCGSWWINYEVESFGTYQSYIGYSFSNLGNVSIMAFLLSSSGQAFSIPFSMTSNNQDVIAELYIGQDIEHSIPETVQLTPFIAHTLTFTNAKGNTLLSAQID